MRNLIIVGARNFAEMSHFFFSEDSDYRVVAFAVDSEFIREDSFKGLPVVALETLDDEFEVADVDVFVAIGLSDLNMARAAKVKQIKQSGFQLASFVSTHATGPAKIAAKPNTMIMDHVCLHPGIDIGENCIVWSCSAIALRTTIEDHCWIVGAKIGESAHIGEYSVIGIDSTIAPTVRVGQKCVIGAGAIVTQDTSSSSVMPGQRSRASKVMSDRIARMSILR